MATVTLMIPDEYTTRIMTALCKTNNLPISVANAKRILIDYLKNATLSYEISLKEQSAQNQIAPILQAKDDDITTVQQQIDAIVIS